MVHSLLIIFFHSTLCLFQAFFWLSFIKWAVKPWSKRLASSCKLKTWVYLWLRLARPCMHLHWLAMICDHFGQNQICTQVNACFIPFGHPTQVSSQVQLAGTCNYLWVHLTRALMIKLALFREFLFFFSWALLFSLAFMLHSFFRNNLSLSNCLLLVNAIVLKVLPFAGIICKGNTFFSPG